MVLRSSRQIDSCDIYARALKIRTSAPYKRDALSLVDIVHEQTTRASRDFKKNGIMLSDCDLPSTGTGFSFMLRHYRAIQT